MPSHFTCCCTLFQLALTSAYAAVVARGSRQKVAAADSLRQLIAAARHAPSFLSPADNWREPASTTTETAKYVRARMTSTFTLNLDLTLKCLYLMSKPWCFDLIDTISNLDALWTTLFVGLFLKIAFISMFYNKFYNSRYVRVFLQTPLQFDFNLKTEQWYQSRNTNCTNNELHNILCRSPVLSTKPKQSWLFGSWPRGNSIIFPWFG